MRRVASPPSHKRRNERLKCWCGGYWFPHRKGGGACDSSPRADYYRALRAGPSKEDAMLELSAVQLDVLFPLTGESKC